MDVQLDPSKDNENWAGITGWQVRRAAWLMHRSLEFKQQLERWVPNLHNFHFYE